MGIFTVLVGATLYGIHGIRQTNAKQRFEHRQRVNERIGMSVAARYELEKEMEEFVGKIENRKIILEKFNDKILKYSQDDGRHCGLFSETCGALEYIWSKKWAVDLLLAEKGFVRSINYYHGFEYGNENERPFCTPILHVIEDLLHEAGHKDLLLVIKPDLNIVTNMWECRRRSILAKVVFLHQVDERLQNYAKAAGRLWKDVS